MQRTLLMLVWIIGVACLLPIHVYSSSKEDFKLQPIKCEKRCQIVFNNEYKDSGLTCSYTSHYSKRINKCFMLVSCNNGVHNETLFDVNGMTRIGGIRYVAKGKVSCSMRGKKCKSKNEWDNLVRPYMTK